MSWALWLSIILVRKIDDSDHSNDPKFPYKQVWANSVDPDQSDKGLHCLPFCLHLLDALLITLQ